MGMAHGYGLGLLMTGNDSQAPRESHDHIQRWANHSLHVQEAELDWTVRR